MSARPMTTLATLLLPTLVILGAALATDTQSALAQGRGAGAGVYDPVLYQALRWRNIGPYRGGRVTAVAGVPDEPRTYYFGATGGGVWKTQSAGEQWRNVSDGDFRTATIGAIAVAPSDSNIVYVGTGESPIRGVTTSHGDGVYKSLDAGKTWSHLGLEDTRHIAAVRIHPKNPDIVYVAAQGSPWAPSKARGIYRSLDGGKTWKQVLFVNETTGASGLAMDATNPRVLYAAMWDHQRRPWTIRSGGPGSGLYKSTDGGETWQPINEGLPALMGNTGVSVSPANPDRVYAMIEATEGGVFRSDDGGAHWKRVNADPGIRDRGWYYTHIFADPIEENTVYVLAAPMMKSTDGGRTFEQVATPHGDNHDLWINPRDNRAMIEGNDGGANVSLDGGKTWSTQANQPTGQFYRVITDNLFPYNVYGGQQDNSSVRIASRTLTGGIGREDWRAVAGGESAFIAFDPDNPILIYGTGILGSINELNLATGELRNIVAYPYFSGFRPGRELKYRFNWNAPVVVSRFDPKVIYHAANVVLKSTDRGRSWAAISPDLTRNDKSRQGTTGGPITIEGAGGEHYATITYLIESPHDPKVLWAGSDDGLVHLTRDGGETWQNVTPRGMPEAQVNAIDVSPHDPATAYIAVTRYKFADLTPMIYRTDDFGKSWRRIVKGIAHDAFVRVVREDPVRRGLLYAGTEAGVYVSFNDGRSWQSLQLNLPPVPITDLTVHGNDLVAATQGRAFWILDDVSPLRQLDKAVAGAAFHLFRPMDALRLDIRGFWRKEAPNPPDGAVIYYTLAAKRAKDAPPITLEILDAKGRVIRTFTSKPAKAARKVVVKGVRGPAPVEPLGVREGLNRYVWNLRREPMVQVSDIIRYVSQRPPRIAPGVYTARLTVDGKSQSQTFKVVPDPRRGPIAADAWAEQQQLLETLYELVNDIHRAVNGARSVTEQIERLMALTAGHGQTDKITAAGKAAIARLKAWEDHVPQAELPGGVQDRVAYPSHLLSTQVLNVISAVDQDPPVTEGARARTRELVDQWKGLRTALRRIYSDDVAAFNVALAAAGVAHVIVP